MFGLRCVPFKTSHNLRCECFKRAHFGKYISFNFDFGSGPFLATGLSPILSFAFINVDPNYWLGSIIQYLACTEFRRLKRLHPIYLVSMKTCRLCACFCSINLYHSLCGSLIVYFYLCWIALVLPTDSDIHILNFTLANRLANANYSFFSFMYFPNAICCLHFAFLLITIRNMILRLLRWLKPRFVSVDFVRIKHWPFTFCVYIDPTVLNQFALCLVHDVVWNATQSIWSDYSIDNAFCLWTTIDYSMVISFPASW